jgi:hypothetical protein
MPSLRECSRPADGATARAMPGTWWFCGSACPHRRVRSRGAHRCSIAKPSPLPFACRCTRHDQPGTHPEQIQPPVEAQGPPCPAAAVPATGSVRSIQPRISTPAASQGLAGRAPRLPPAGGQPPGMRSEEVHRCSPARRIAARSGHESQCYRPAHWGARPSAIARPASLKSSDSRQRICASTATLKLSSGSRCQAASMARRAP